MSHSAAPCLTRSSPASGGTRLPQRDSPSTAYDPSRSLQLAPLWGFVRVTRWRFVLGDEKLIFTSEVDAEEPLPGSEKLAYELCSALGFPLPSLATELDQVA
jgi:hypothetical protein